MPTAQSMKLPLPKNWQEFESMVRDAQAQSWKSPSLQKNGRTGQQQKGVDVWGPDDLGRRVGIQCKCYKGPLTLVTVTDEIVNAEAFKPALNTLWIATTAEHDATLQEQVRILSEQRALKGDFAIGLLFWDEIIAGLVLNPAVFKSHYPQIQLQSADTASKERQLAALELGWYGADLWEYVALVHGEIGWLAQVDPDELIAKLRIMQFRAQQLLAPEDATPILAALSSLLQICAKQGQTETDWSEAKLLANRVSARVQSASSLLPMGESNALMVARELGRIYHQMDDCPSIATQTNVRSKVKTILGEGSEAPIATTFEEAAKVSSGYLWAMRVFSLIDREIRFR